MASTQPQDACSQLPPASSDYKSKGSWDTIAGLNTYTTGPADAKRAIIFIYDIFGPAPQTLQGADRLADAIGARVLVPDFFDGERAQPGWMPADTEEKKTAFAKFRAERADTATAVERLLALRKEAGSRFGATVDEEGGWAVFGLCWGGKVGVLVSGAGNEGKGRRFAASGTAHPS
jgi:dienelactone hydrolase